MSADAGQMRGGGWHLPGPAAPPHDLPGSWAPVLRLFPEFLLRAPRAHAPCLLKVCEDPAPRILVLITTSVSHGPWLPGFGCWGPSRQVRHSLHEAALPGCLGLHQAPQHRPGLVASESRGGLRRAPKAQPPTLTFLCTPNTPLSAGERLLSDTAVNRRRRGL